MPSKKKHTKKNHKKTQKKRGGSCACQQSVPLKLFGGSPHLNEVPSSAYYAYNSNLTNDPTSPSNVHSARFMGDFSRMSGGKRNKSRRKRRSNKSNRRNAHRYKQKGGVNFFSNMYDSLQSTGSGSHYVTALGSLNSVNTQSNLLAGIDPPNNTSSYSQPVIDSPYGFSNPPLV